MPTKIRFQTITPNDLANVNSFRKWIKKNLEHLYTRKDVPTEHLLIYIDYMKSIIQKNKKVDVPFWMSLIRKLDSDIKSLKKVEE